MPKPAESLDELLRLVLGGWASKLVLAAVELGVFGVLADGPRSGDELARSVGLHPRAARDVLDALVALGLLTRRAERYANAPAADAFLVDGRAASVGGFLQLVGTRLDGMWTHLAQALRTGRPQNEIADGGDLYAALYAQPEGRDAFLAAMTGLNAAAGVALAERFAWGERGSFVDVGCAAGAVAVAIAARHEHLSGVGFDLAVVRAAFEEQVAAHDLASRLRFQAGDVFEDDLPTADVMILGHVLHNWDTEQRRTILARVHDRLPGGAVIVCEWLVDDDRSENALALLMGLHMLLETHGGRNFTGAECGAWLRDVGFERIRSELLCGPASMVVGVKV